jgi:hypothetical protein
MTRTTNTTRNGPLFTGSCATAGGIQLYVYTAVVMGERRGLVGVGNVSQWRRGLFNPLRSNLSVLITRVPGKTVNAHYLSYVLTLCNMYCECLFLIRIGVGFFFFLRSRNEHTIGENGKLCRNRFIHTDRRRGALRPSGKY